jgi:hypothetical protein
VEQLLVHALREVANGPLGDAILKMSIDAAEGELLSGVVAGLPEGVVIESPIVAVVMLYLYAVFGSKLFERALGLEGLLGGKIEHEMDESEAREVVHKDGGDAGATQQVVHVDVGARQVGHLGL